MRLVRGQENDSLVAAADGKIFVALRRLWSPTCPDLRRRPAAIKATASMNRRCFHAKDVIIECQKYHLKAQVKMSFERDATLAHLNEVERTAADGEPEWFMVCMHEGCRLSYTGTQRGNAARNLGVHLARVHNHSACNRSSAFALCSHATRARLCVCR